MRANAELHPNVVYDLKDVYPPAEVADFFRELARVCEDPLRNSELFVDPRLSRYVLRRFSFGTGVEKIAIFHYDLRRESVRVLKCRPLKPKHFRDPRAPKHEAPP